MEDDDEVLGELPLTLSRPSAPANLHVLQYPLRNPSHPVGFDRPVTSVRVRPRTGRVHVSVAVKPTPNSNSFIPNDFEKNIGETQTLVSNPHRSAPNANFCLTAIRDGTVVLAPVTSVAQLRPAFNYIDDYELDAWKTKMEQKALHSGEKGASTTAPLEMSFRKRESERAAERRRNSHATFRQKEEAEPWQDLSFVGKDKVDLSKVLATPVHDLHQESKFDPNTDFHALFLEHTRLGAFSSVGKSKTELDSFSVGGLRTLKVDSAVRHMFVNARILRVDSLCEVLEAERAEVLKACQSVAMCVRGCWVCKEGVRENGRPRSVTARYEMARVLVLNLFRYNRIIKGVEAEEALGNPMPVTAKVVEEILAEVAERRRGAGWELRVEDDDDFERDSPEMCLKQNEEWSRRLHNAQQALAKFHRQAQQPF